MEEIRVARARLEEVQPLAAEFRRDASKEGAPVEAPLPTGAVFWIARSTSGDPLGYAAGTLRPEGLVLGPFFVRSAHRRSGVGMRLLREIERWAEGARIPVVEVSVATDNLAGVRFLEAAGYRARRMLMARQAPVVGAGSGTAGEEGLRQ
jgi:GNAT superfamily N-acetyltransferase